MVKLFLKTVFSIFNSDYVFNDDIFITDFSTDSRIDSEGKIFFALEGENFNGHDFIKQVFENGAVAAVVNHKYSASFLNDTYLKSKPLIFVDDTLIALGKFAKFYKKKFDVLTVGITGSNGKTTTKNMLSHIFSDVKKTVSTIKNFNNAIGLPLSISKIDNDTETCIFELGMNNFNEIRYLADIAQLNSAVITSIYPSHLDDLHSIDNVIKAKSEILENLKDNIAFLNSDDENVMKTLSCVNKDLNVIKFGLNDSYVKFEVLNNINGYYSFSFNSIPVNLKVAGYHNLYNAFAAVTVAKYYQIPDDVIKKKLESFVSKDKRTEIYNVNNITVFNDCYNSNPGSVKSAFKTLQDLNHSGNVFIIFGDMLELGPQSEKLHLDTMELFYDIENLKNVFFIGKEVKIIYDKILFMDVRKFYYDKSDESINEVCTLLKNQLQPGDLLFLKGSRGIKLERILDKLF